MIFYISIYNVFFQLSGRAFEFPFVSLCGIAVLISIRDKAKRAKEAKDGFDSFLMSH